VKTYRIELGYALVFFCTLLLGTVLTPTRVTRVTSRGHLSKEKLLLCNDPRVGLGEDCLIVRSPAPLRNERNPNSAFVFAGRSR
jgi:hypothetical protein